MKQNNKNKELSTSKRLMLHFGLNYVQWLLFVLFMKPSWFMFLSAFILAVISTAMLQWRLIVQLLKNHQQKFN